MFYWILSTLITMYLMFLNCSFNKASCLTDVKIPRIAIYFLYMWYFIKEDIFNSPKCLIFASGIYMYICFWFHTFRVISIRLLTVCAYDKTAIWYVRFLNEHSDIFDFYFQCPLSDNVKARCIWLAIIHCFYEGRWCDLACK